MAVRIARTYMPKPSPTAPRIDVYSRSATPDNKPSLALSQSFVVSIVVIEGAGRSRYMPNDWYVRRLPAGVPVCPHIEDGVVRPFVAWVPTEASARGMAAFHANVTMRRGFQGLVMRHAPLIVCHIPRFSPRSGSGG